MELLVNGKKYSITVDEKTSLLTVLRDYLDLTGSKYGCGEGVCGACTVLIGDNATRSCILPVGNVKGKAITTIEGLATNGKMHKVQQAFIKVDVFQCAYCASGMIMSAVSLLKKNSRPDEEDIMTGMQGNVCRCGTYARIINAIKEAANNQG